MDYFAETKYVLEYIVGVDTGIALLGFAWHPNCVEQSKSQQWR